MFERISELRKKLPRLTFTGYNYLLISLTVTLLGILTAEHAVFFTGLLLIVSMVFSYMFSFLSLSRLGIRRILHGSFVAGDLFVIQYEIENRNILLPAFHVLITDLCANRVFHGSYYRLNAEAGIIPPGGKSFASYSGRIRERGILRFNRIQLTTKFPFGIFSCSKDYMIPEEIESFPRSVNIQERGIFSREVTGYSDQDSRKWERGYDVFRGVRDYRRGDNPRWIDWKSSAKYRGHLRIKEFNSSEERDIFIIFDPAAGVKGRRSRNTKFEISVVYAVSLVRHYMEKGNRVTFLTYCDGLCEVNTMRTPGDYRKVLSLMAGIRDGQQDGMYSVIARRSRGLKRTGAGIVIIGAGITDIYRGLFRGQNIQLIDMARENIRKAFLASPLIR